MEPVPNDQFVDEKGWGTRSLIRFLNGIRDAVETAVGLSSPLTTKGDLWGYSTTDARVPVGTDGQVLTADSGETLGVKWATPTSGGALEVLDEGVSKDTAVESIDFVGAGVTATNTGHAVTVTIPGGSGAPDDLSYLTVADESGNLPNSRQIDFLTPIAGADGGPGQPYQIGHVVSGVSASTYGDSLNVPQVAINATGHATSASNVAIATMVGDSGSGGTKGLVPAPASGDAAAKKFLMADGAWTELPPSILREVHTVRMGRWLQPIAWNSNAQNQMGIAYGGNAFVAGPSAPSNTYGGQWPTLRISAGTGQNALNTNRATNMFVFRGNASNVGGWYWKLNGYFESVAVTSKVMLGFMTESAAGSLAASSVPSNQVDCCFFGFDNGDTNWQFMHNDASGTCTKVDLGSNFPAQTIDRVYSWEISCPGNDGNITYTMTRQDTGAVATGTVSTNLPTNTTGIEPFHYVQGNTAASASAATTIGLYREYLEIGPDNWFY